MGGGEWLGARGKEVWDCGGVMREAVRGGGRQLELEEEGRVDE